MADDDDVAVLRAALEAGDLPRLAAALAPLSEPARRAAWPQLATTSFHRTPADVLLALGCAPTAAAAGQSCLASFVAESDEPLLLRVLVDRQPRWLPALTKRLLTQDLAPDWGFRVVRGLIREGLVERPEYPEYVAAMVSRLVRSLPHRPGAPTVLDALRSDRALLDDELWRLLAQERIGRRLQRHDHWLDRPFEDPHRPAVAPKPDGTWRHAVAVLTAEGAIARDRLLDVALGAVLADRAAADVTWFVTLVDALAPTDDEIAARRQTYLRLVASDVGPVVQLGLAGCRRLLDGGAEAAVAVARALAPALTRPQKGTALAALALLEHIGRRHPAARSEVAAAAAYGRDHAHADVRERAAALAETAGPSAGGAQGSRTATVAAQASVPVPPGTSVPRPAATLATASTPAPRPVRTPAPVVPVASADELAELFVHLIEEADDPLEVERALDGVLRFRAAPPRHGARALAQRALDVTAAFPGPWFGDVRADLAEVVQCWLTGRAPRRCGASRTVGHTRTEDVSETGERTVRVTALWEPDWTLYTLTALRTHEVAWALCSPAPGPVLSLPATADGAIPAAELVTRLAGARSARPLDLGLAVLRVPPRELTDLELPPALRQHLGDDLHRLAVHAPKWTRIVAATTDRWNRPTPPLVLWSDPASPQGAPDKLIPAVLDRRDPVRLAALEADDGEYAARPEQLTALWPLMLPHHLDLLAAHAHPRLARATAKNRSGATPLVDAIGRSVQPGTAPTWSALTLGMAAKETPVRTAAVDAFVVRAGRGLLDTAGLAAQVRLCLADDVVVGTRIADALADAGRADVRSAEAALAVLVDVAPALPGRRDAHRWIDALAELGQRLDHPVVLPPEFRDLTDRRDGTALGRACRRVRQMGEAQAAGGR